LPEFLDPARAHDPAGKFAGGLLDVPGVESS